MAGLPAEGPPGALGQRAGAGGAGVEAGEDSFPRFETQQQQQHQYEQQGQGDFEIEGESARGNSAIRRQGSGGGRGRSGRAVVGC